MADNTEHDIARDFEELRAKIPALNEQEQAELRKKVEEQVISTWVYLQEASQKAWNSDEEDLHKEQDAITARYQQMFRELKRVRNMLVPPNPQQRRPNGR